MTIEPSDEDPFAGDEGTEIPVEEEEPAFNWMGLRNTEPPVGPGELEGQLEWGAPWYHDMVAGFIKQSGGRGLEAWHHYVIALAKLWLAAQQDRQRDAEERSSEGGYVEQEPEEPFHPTGPAQDEDGSVYDRALDRDL